MVWAGSSINELSFLESRELKWKKKTLQIEVVGFTRKPEMDGLDVGAGKIFSRSMALLNRTKDF